MAELCQMHESIRFFILLELQAGESGTRSVSKQLEAQENSEFLARRNRVKINN